MFSGCVVSHRAVVEGLPAIVRFASRMQVRDQREVKNIPHDGVMDGERYISRGEDLKRPRSPKLEAERTCVEYHADMFITISGA